MYTVIFENAMIAYYLGEVNNVELNMESRVKPQRHVKSEDIRTFIKTIAGSVLSPMLWELWLKMAIEVWLPLQRMFVLEMDT